MKNPSLITNLIKTKEKKNKLEDIKMSQHYYFDSFELHIKNPIALNKVERNAPESCGCRCSKWWIETNQVP